MPVQAPVERTGTRARLAELVAALSLGIDLGFGQPMEHVLRQCLIALRIAQRMGLDDEERATVYYTALLVNVGCHTDAHEQAKWFGDDIALRSKKYDHDGRSIRGALSGLRLLGSGQSPLHRFRLGLEFAVSGYRNLDGMIAHHAAMAQLLAEQLELPDAVLDAVGSTYERWDGRGWPGRLAGDEIPEAARIAPTAEFMEVAHRLGGVDAARRLARERRGKHFDPTVADIVAADADLLLAGLDAASTWDAVIDAEPSLTIVLDGERFERALKAIGDFIDLKSPYFLGHARGVSELAADAAARAQLPARDVATLRQAGLVHDLGRLGVSNAILDKPGPLGAGEWERIRFQPYLSERILGQAPALAPLARLALQHRERLDGSGYPQGLDGTALGATARILAAADAYHAMREPRPYRGALAADDAAAELRTEARRGRYDGDAVDAVLAAAGHRVGRRREAVAGLTRRELDVLRLLARGLSNRQIASELTISPKTVGNHVEHIYSKIGTPTRAAAALFAVQHGLLAEELAPA